MNDIDAYVAKKLKYYRNKFGLPLKTLSSDLGISLQQLQRYESGANKVSAGLVYKMSRVFKIDMECFFDGLEEEPVPTSKSYRILLIEDNADDEFFFRKAVHTFDQNIEIYVLKDGGEAVKYFRDLQDNTIRFFTKPDIIFVDVHLPSLNGFDVVTDLKKRPPLSAIPVVFLTGSVNEEDVAKSYNLHANGYIRKSFKYEEYNEQISKALTYWIRIASLPPHQEKNASKKAISCDGESSQP